ncbi:MAG: NifU family protein [Romboutsia sp.]
MTEKTSEIIKSIRPILQEYGKSIKLVDLNNQGVVLIKLEGESKNCPESIATLKLRIENLLFKEVDGIKQVIGI